MEEWCAVCAEPLEWVAYGPCGHREVCFTCTARLRFVLEDKRCCICKQDCPCVFVTKALGDYTKVLTDFSVLQEQQQLNRSSEEKTQSKYWYESNVQAFFDDEEPFRIIEAMCRLYCSACEGIILAGESLPKGGVKKGHIFKSLELLRSHLFSAHKLIMCELCLKGRKVFICEQKLYTRTQLEQHLVKGDSKVDGTQEERAGFTGHPMCEFCRKRFYGENELYAHMSTEHYTCHFCQRSRPGHFEYYRNYDDLEMHFRNDHELCEHPDCLAKKFVVFANQADLKHHNATTHGGNMSRSQRNAALQIPVSFQYRRPGQDSRDDVGDRGPAYRRGGRDRGSFPSNVRVVADSLDAAVQGSVESALLESAIRESAAMSASIESTAVGSSGVGEALDAANSLSVSDTQGDGGEGGIVVSRYASAVSGSGPSSLVNSAFPPLPGLSQNVLPKAKLRNQAPSSMAALLGGGGGRGGIQVLNLAASRPLTAKADQGVWGSNNTGSTDRGSMVQGTSTQAKGKLQGVGAWASSNGGSIHQGTLVGGARSEEEEPLQGVSAVSGSGPPPGAYRSAPGGVISSSGSGRVISPLRTADDRDGADSEVELSMEELRAANKALIKRIHAGLKDNEKQFADFKDVSDQFRKGAMSAKDYTGHITRLGLLHIVPELARLCPDPVKRKELLERVVLWVLQQQPSQSQAKGQAVQGMINGSRKSPNSSGCDWVMDLLLQDWTVLPRFPREALLRMVVELGKMVVASGWYPWCKQNLSLMLLGTTSKLHDDPASAPGLL
ncbi:hypothetical protein BDL97_17G089800 [Sphagnum fallax]|nr:hypothetical protein BDL97_17G089800 [Sphagnum fallax]KAH8936522.1 hypothetical protein BDL97_17G089800 [Sphagnum fallax]